MMRFIASYEFRPAPLHENIVASLCLDIPDSIYSESGTSTTAALTALADKLTQALHWNGAVSGGLLERTIYAEPVDIVSYRPSVFILEVQALLDWQLIARVWVPDEIEDRSALLLPLETAFAKSLLQFYWQIFTWDAPFGETSFFAGFERMWVGTNEYNPHGVRRMSIHERGDCPGCGTDLSRRGVCDDPICPGGRTRRGTPPASREPVAPAAPVIVPQEILPFVPGAWEEDEI